MEGYCKRCSHWDARMPPPRGQPVCPRCAAPLWKRKGVPPGPGNHLRALLKSIVSMPGLLFMALYAFLAAAPLGWQGQLMVLVLLFLGSVKMAYAAMNAAGGRIEFPSLDPREFFDSGTLVPRMVYAGVFMVLPALLVQLALHAGEEPAAGRAHRAAAQESAAAQDDLAAEDTGDTPQIAAARRAVADLQKAQQPAGQEERPAGHKKWYRRLGALEVAEGLGALLLLLYSAMALVLFLRSNTVGAMFRVDAGVSVMARDLRGYLALAAAVVAINGLRLILDLDVFQKGFLVAVVASGGKALLNLLVYGLCGLYTRQQARLLDVPCDDEDWELFISLESLPSAPAPAAPARPRVVVPLELEEEPAASAPLDLSPRPPAGPPVTATPAPYINHAVMTPGPWSPEAPAAPAPTWTPPAAPAWSPAAAPTAPAWNPPPASAPVWGPAPGAPAWSAPAAAPPAPAWGATPHAPWAPAQPAPAAPATPVDLKRPR